jgi:hypothetical protein
LPASEAVQVRIEDPEPPLTDKGESEQVRLVEFVVATSVTAPVNPSSGATAMEDVPEALLLSVTETGLAVSVKSWTVYATWADAVFAPLLPFTVTVYEPAEPLHDSVEFPVAANVVTLRLQESPVLREIVSLRVTVPMNVGANVMVIVELAVEPARTVMLAG